MRSNAPALVPILRSRTQAGVLAVTLLNPEQEYTLTELARRLEASLSSVHDEVRRLEEAEILTSRQVGRARLVRAGSGPMVGPLTRLIQIAFGPREVISEEFAEIDGIGELMLFGSLPRHRRAGSTRHRRPRGLVAGRDGGQDTGLRSGGTSRAPPRAASEPHRHHLSPVGSAGSG